MTLLYSRASSGLQGWLWTGEVVPYNGGTVPKCIQCAQGGCLSSSALDASSLMSLPASWTVNVVD